MTVLTLMLAPIFQMRIIKFASTCARAAEYLELRRHDLKAFRQTQFGREGMMLTIRGWRISGWRWKTFAKHLWTKVNIDDVLNRAAILSFYFLRKAMCCEPAIPLRLPPSAFPSQT